MPDKASVGFPAKSYNSYMSAAFVPVIMCGGSGSRLWPASREDWPKQFAALPGLSRPLLAEAYARLRGAPMSPTAVLTVAASDSLFLCEEMADEWAPSGAEHVFIGEPQGRNTAAAIAAAAAAVARRFGEDAVMFAMPADHLVGNEPVFWEAAAKAADAAKAGRIALLGMTPEYPATAYGYIEFSEKDVGGCFAVTRFVEKPDATRADKYLAAGNFLWNAGVFCFTPATLAAELRKSAPDFLTPLENFKKHDDGGRKILPLAADYEKFPAISFDYAVAEKTACAAVAKAEGAQWSDVGSWRALAERLPADADGNRGDAMFLDSNNCFAAADKVAAIVGLENVCVVDTSDALLVLRAEKAERVRDVFERLRREGGAAARSPSARRPWGGYEVLSEGAGYKVKRIEVKPGGILSLQSHRHRSEHWTTVEGVMTVHVEGREFDMKKDESCYIPLGAKHRMRNGTDSPAAVIEVQIGDYLGEDDIVRYEDAYGRA